MMNYPKLAYGRNPLASRNPNLDYGWGSHQWPAGVPQILLGTLKFQGKLGQITVVARKELLPLIATLMAITEEMGYYFHPGWCWSYANRSVTGGKLPSNHSRGKALDVNAPRNPFSTTFISDIPPAVVALWESHGFYWGGRYVNQATDAMHFEFVFTPSDVARFLRSALGLLEDLEDEVKPEDKKEIIDGVVKALTPVVKAQTTAAINALRFDFTNSRLRPPVEVKNRTLEQTLDFIATSASSAEGGAVMAGRIFGYDPEDRDEFEAAAKAGKTKDNRE